MGVALHPRLSVSQQHRSWRFDVRLPYNNPVVPLVDCDPRMHASQGARELCRCLVPYHLSSFHLLALAALHTAPTRFEEIDECVMVLVSRWVSGMQECMRTRASHVLKVAGAVCTCTRPYLRTALCTFLWSAAARVPPAKTRLASRKIEDDRNVAWCTRRDYK